LGFNPAHVNWLEEFDRSFANPGLIHVTISGRKIIIETDPAIFQSCPGLAPAARISSALSPGPVINFALDFPEHSLWVKPDDPVTLSMANKLY